MKIHSLRVLASLFVVSLLLSAILTIAFASEIGEPQEPVQPAPEFPVIPEFIVGTSLLATYIFLRRKSRSK